MFKRKGNLSILIMALVLSIALVGCGSNDSGEDGEVLEENIAEQMDFKITGVDAGAGVVQGAERAVEEYGLEFDVQTSSGAVMTQALADAIANEEPIIVTGWTPHWKFIEYDLKYLEDPKGVFGGEETINTFVRLGLGDEKPNAHKILDQFNWKAEDMEFVMLEISEGTDPKEAAQKWIDLNKDKINEWTDGADKVDGEEVELAYVSWDSNIASINVVALVLEDMGFDVKTTQVEGGPMFAAVASGDADAFVSGWIPVTHGDYYDDYIDDLEDLGPNLEGAKIGLVVPTYMDINSIEDLVEFKK